MKYEILAFKFLNFPLGYKNKFILLNVYDFNKFMRFPPLSRSPAL